MVVLEAMAAGVPVVAANVGGVPDLVDEGVSGILCDPLNPESMQSAIALVLEDENRARRMANTARQQALQRFHPREIARRHMEIYRELLSSV